MRGSGSAVLMIEYAGPSNRGRLVGPVFSPQAAALGALFT
jgi:hypothetical protein